MGAWSMRAVFVGCASGVRERCEMQVATAFMQESMRRQSATLYLFASLPGSGKSTLAQRLAQHVGAAYVRIDTIEQALRDVRALQAQGAGGCRRWRAPCAY